LNSTSHKQAVHSIYKAIAVFLFCFLWLTPLYPESIPDNVQGIMDSSTFIRTQKPFAVRTDRKTLEYFIEHVEELSKYEKDYNKKEPILEVKGNNRYGVQIPSKHVTGEFSLVERQPQRVIYMGHGNAASIFNFSGYVILVVDYATQADDIGSYEEVRTSVYVKFDNALLAFVAKVASPFVIPKLDKFMTKFSTKTKKAIEYAYAIRKGTK